MATTHGIAVLRRVHAIGTAVALTAVGLALGGATAPAATCPTADSSHFTVTSSSDSDAGPAGSLRAAIAAAHAAGGGAVCIVPGVGTIHLVRPLGFQDSSGTLDISGNGATVVGNGTFLLLQGGAASIAVDDLTMAFGRNPLCCGGAIATEGALSVTNSTFVDNVAGTGGALSTHGGGTVTVVDSTFLRNRAFGAEGGGAIVAGSDVTVVRSTFASNEAAAGGGGAIVSEGGVVTVTNSTFADNSAARDGGAIEVPVGGTGRLMVAYSTFSENSTVTGSSALAAPDASESLVFGSVFVKAGDASLCLGGIGSAGYNFANESANSCDLNATGDTSVDTANAALEPLADNGGPTPTMLPGLAVLDRIPDADCSGGDDLVAAVITTDQRGMARPAPSGGSCDIGAIEIPVPRPVAVQRIWGQDAIDTALAVSQTQYAGSGSASAVVLARSDYFSDALAGGPLAAADGGPLLITPGASASETIDPRVLAEIQRVLPAGRPVYVLGGPLALPAGIDETLRSLGYGVVRVQGANQYATAVAIAEQLGNPSVVFEATGLDFADALSAVPAAVELRGAILLTDGTTQAPETAQYLAAHPPSARYAIGGPLAAAGADPGAVAVYGQDLFATSAAVASAFFPQAETFGAATGLHFADALSGGVFMADPAHTGPVLLVNPDLPLPPSVANYLAIHPSISHGYVFGGPLAVSAAVLAAL